MPALICYHYAPCCLAHNLETPDNGILTFNILYKVIMRYYFNVFFYKAGAVTNIS